MSSVACLTLSIPIAGLHTFHDHMDPARFGGMHILCACHGGHGPSLTSVGSSRKLKPADPEIAITPNAHTNKSILRQGAAPQSFGKVHMSYLSGF